MNPGKTPEFPPELVAEGRRVIEQMLRHKEEITKAYWIENRSTASGAPSSILRFRAKDDDGQQRKYSVFLKRDPILVELAQHQVSLWREEKARETREQEQNDRLLAYVLKSRTHSHRAYKRAMKYYQKHSHNPRWKLEFVLCGCPLPQEVLHGKRRGSPSSSGLW